VTDLSINSPNLLPDDPSAVSPCAQSNPAPVDQADNEPREECGVFGVWAPGEDVAKLSYYGLYALQHRGQEAAGIAVGDGAQVIVFKDLGLVSQVFDEQTMASMLDDWKHDLGELPADLPHDRSRKRRRPGAQRQPGEHRGTGGTRPRAGLGQQRRRHVGLRPRRRAARLRRR
jgi:hypothetical protein